MAACRSDAQLLLVRACAGRFTWYKAKQQGGSTRPAFRIHMQCMAPLQPFQGAIIALLLQFGMHHHVQS